MQKDIIKLKEVEEDIPRCPYCNSGDVVKYGFQRNRVQRYRCNTCRKIFNQRYGTLANVDIYIDEEFVGQTDENGKLIVDVVEGETHFIKAMKTDYYPKIKSIDIGYYVESTSITIYLDYAKAPITVYVKDEKGYPLSNANVSFNGNFVGVTDINGKLTTELTKNNDYFLTVELENYHTENGFVHVDTYGKDINVILKLEDKNAPNIFVYDNFEILGDEDSVIEEGERIRVTYSVYDENGVSNITCRLDGVIIDSYHRGGHIQLLLL